MVAKKKIARFHDTLRICKKSGVDGERNKGETIDSNKNKKLIYACYKGQKKELEKNKLSLIILTQEKALTSSSQLQINKCKSFGWVCQLGVTWEQMGIKYSPNKRCKK